MLSGRDVRVNVTAMEGTRGKPTWVWNRLFDAACDAGCEYFFQSGDDIELITPGWADALVAALAGNRYLPNFGVAGPTDTAFDTTAAWSSHFGGPPMLTQAFTHCTHRRVHGGLYPNAFANWYSDDWISQVYGRRNTFALARLRVRNPQTTPRYPAAIDARDLVAAEIDAGRRRQDEWMRSHHPTRPAFAATQLDALHDVVFLPNLLPRLMPHRHPPPPPAPRVLSPLAAAPVPTPVDVRASAAAVTTAAQPWHRRYTRAQYMPAPPPTRTTTPRCTVARADAPLADTAVSTPPSGCSVRSLPGFGFNPSAVEAPAALVAAAERAGVFGVAYVGTSRVHQDNRAVDCANPAVHVPLTPTWLERARTGASASDLLLLDADLRVLRSAPLRGGACTAHVNAVVDARLLARSSGGGLLVSYSTHASYGRPECLGHWLARVEATFDETGQLRARLGGVDDAGGFSLNGTRGVPLTAARNSGIVLGAGAPAVELVESYPRLRFALPSGVVAHFAAAPPTFGPATHNSIHPLWLPELGLYLAVAHRHLHADPHSAGQPARALVDGEAATPPPFEWGYGYVHTLYTLTPELRVARYSDEFCLPALTTASAPSAEAAGDLGGGAGTSAGDELPHAGTCEGIQFVMGALSVPAKGVALLYGVQDCEAAVVSLSLDELQRLLKHRAAAEDGP